MCLVYINVGEPGSGKTWRGIEKLREFFDAKKIKSFFVNDIQLDPAYADENWITRFRGSISSYLSKVIYPNLFKGSKKGIIVEEARLILRHNDPDPKLEEGFLSKRHHGNVYVFNFHSLQQVPEWVLPYVNYFYISRSAGKPQAIALKYAAYPKIIEAFEAVRNLPEGSKSFVEVRIS